MTHYYATARGHERGVRHYATARAGESPVELRLFTFYQRDRASYRPAACREPAPGESGGGEGCWVVEGPPAITRRYNPGRCKRCDACPRLPRGAY